MGDEINFMKKSNCWEIKKCGREPGGPNIDDLGVCPAALDKRLDGIHGGENGGRACWVVAGSLCDGEIQGIFVDKYDNCCKCEFYMKVKSEESSEFKMTAALVSMVQ
jgi:hypothetical protein